MNFFDDVTQADYAQVVKAAVALLRCSAMSNLRALPAFQLSSKGLLFTILSPRLIMKERFLRATNHFKQQHKCNNEKIKANVFFATELGFSKRSRSSKHQQRFVD